MVSSIDLLNLLILVYLSVKELSLKLHFENLIITSGGGLLSYRSTLKQKNCGNGEIILEEDECKDASEALGREYVGRSTSKKRPAGCYWVLKFLSNREYAYSYFNTIVDASSTDPINGREHGGICRTLKYKPYTG